MTHSHATPRPAPMFFSSASALTIHDSPEQEVELDQSLYEEHDEPASIQIRPCHSEARDKNARPAASFYLLKRVKSPATTS